MTAKKVPVKKNTKQFRKKKAAPKSFTIPFDVAVLILSGILIFIIFLLAYRSCSADQEQFEKMKINLELSILDSQEVGTYL
jgi:heme/copper-type cytochrome/quinol oxidase subunit 3